MPVIGLDLGSDNMVIALALRGGIDVIVNEFSRRSTPTVVSFTEKNREIGESALNMIAFNGPNTVPNVKRVIGLKYSQIPKEELEQFPCKVMADENDDVLFEVQYLDQTRRFTSVQILAMVLTKARLIAEQEANAKGIEAVISTPAYFTDKQRRAILQAADIAGIRVISLLSDTLAAATEYTIYRTIDEKQTLNVAFVDVGHSDTTVSIMAITKNQAKVLATGFHRDLGARDFETVLLNHLIAQAASKYKLDVNSNKRAKTKLGRECEKLKKVLSINPKAQIRLECFMNDMDVAFEVTREEFEQMSQPLLTNFAEPIQKTLAESKLKPEQINFVELFGGGSYIPSLRKIISQTFNLPVSTTLNAAETIARGCAFQGALMTPYFRLAKDVNVIDAIPFPVNLGYKSSTSMEVDTSNELEQVNKQSEVFKVGEGSPNTKLLTFSRNGDFELYALYGNSDRLTKGTEQFLSKFTVQKVPAKQSTVKVRVKHNHNGIVAVDQAELVEEVEVLEEPKPAPAPAPAPAEGAPAAAQEAPKQEAPKVVKKTIRTELPVVAFCPYELTAEQLKKAKAEEEAMQAQDRLIIETAEAKNNVETFVYSYREKLDGAFAKFVDPKVKDQFLSALDAAESWLYDEGAETTKEEYLKKISSLQTFALPAENRKSESEARGTAAKSLEGWISQYAAFVASNDEKYAHITPAEKEKVAQKVDETKNWLSSEISKINAAPAHVDPSIKAADIAKKEKELKSYCDPIVTKPKPEPPKQEEKKEEAPKQEPAQQTQQQPQEKQEMDVE